MQEARPHPLVIDKTCLASLPTSKERENIAASPFSRAPRSSTPLLTGRPIPLCRRSDRVSLIRRMTDKRKEAQCC